jgi:NAD(P)-dependent dehydrogenase (short-subunit alcohol dehydrogenase family)
MRTVLVTGANGNVGRAVVGEFQRLGWNVVGADVTDVDCTDGEAVINWVSKQNFTSLHAVVHTIGGIRAGATIDKSPASDAVDMMQLNYFTAVHIAQSVLPYLEASAGAFIAIGAQTLLRPMVKKGFYTAAKSALSALILTMAEEGRQSGMRANVVVPSIVRTPQNLEWAQHGEETTWVTPQQLAVVIASLCQPDNLTSGAIVPVLAGVNV